MSDQQQPNGTTAPPAASPPATQLPQDVVNNMTSILTNLMEQKFAEPFLEPVDWKMWKLFDYLEVIKTPMDLGTVEGKLKRGEYASFDAFKADVQLVIDNCTTYNDKKSEVYKQALKMQKAFDKEVMRAKSGTPGGSVANDRPNGSAGGGNGPVTLVRPKAPTIEEKDKFCKLVFQMRALDLGRIIELIDEICPQAIERSGRDEIDINVDVIDAAAYRKLEALARDLVAKDKDLGVAANKRKRVRADGAAEEAEEEEPAEAS